MPPPARLPPRLRPAPAALTAAALALAACSPPLPLDAFAAAGPLLSPMDFFDGHATSWGVLESPGGAPTRWFTVTSSGHRVDGELVLDQAIHWHGGTNDGQIDRRTWRLRPLDTQHSTASLTDAEGPVQAETAGPLLHLTYALKSVPAGRMEQWLYLQPDGRTLLNEGTIRILGLLVARLSERITRDPSPPAKPSDAACPQTRRAPGTTAGTNPCHRP